MSYPLEAGEFGEEHRDFIQYLLDWYHSLRPMSLAELTGDGERSGEIVFVSADLIKGFTTEGRLASERIAGIVPNVVDLFTRAYGLGVRDFILIQDSHPEDSLQFEAYGRHAAKGSREAETVDELLALPFSGEFTILYKESLSPAIGTGLEQWMVDRPRIRTVIVVGDCTDICTYQFSLWFKMWSSATRRRLNVIVPEDCTETYDVGVSTAAELGITPHDADFLHLVFLYHMALNAVRVVSRLE